MMKPLAYHAGRWEKSNKSVISEQAVTLTVNGNAWLSFMCTPIDLEALAIGFLFNEEIIQSIQEVASVRVCPGNDNIDVWLSQSVDKPTQWFRTSGCSGGTTSVDGRDHRPGQGIPRNGSLLEGKAIGALIDLLLDAQELYRQTGGVHTSALSDGEKILVSAEDIGRHNTLDKIAGRCLQENISPMRRVILTTGRISSEMLQKASRMRASIVISRTSPTSLSVKRAEELGITLIGYARREHFIVYSHAERIITTPVNETLSSEVR